MICQPWVDKCTTSMDYPVQCCDICGMPTKGHDNISEYDSLYNNKNNNNNNNNNNNK